MFWCSISTAWRRGKFSCSLIFFRWVEIMPISFRVVTQWTIFLAWNISQSHEASEGEWLDVFKHVARVVEEVASKHQTNDSPAGNRILSCLISWREGYGRRCGRLEKDLDARSPVVTCLQRERLLCVQGQGDVSMSQKLGTPANPDIIVFHTPLWIHYSKSRYTHIQYAPFGGMPLWWNILHQTWLEAASKLQAVVFTRWCEEFFHWTPLDVIMMWYQTCISVQVLKHVSVDELCRWNFGSGSRCSQSTQCVFSLRSKINWVHNMTQTPIWCAATQGGLDIDRIIQPTYFYLLPSTS